MRHFISLYTDIQSGLSVMPTPSFRRAYPNKPALKCSCLGSLFRGPVWEVCTGSVLLKTWPGVAVRGLERASEKDHRWMVHRSPNKKLVLRSWLGQWSRSIKIPTKSFVGMTAFDAFSSGLQLATWSKQLVTALHEGPRTAFDSAQRVLRF